MFTWYLDGKTASDTTHDLIFPYPGQTMVEAYTADGQIWQKNAETTEEWILSTNEGSPEFNANFISTDNDVFSLKLPVSFYSVQAEIDAGELAAVTPDLSGFKTVSTITVL